MNERGAERGRLVDRLLDEGYLRPGRVAEAMRKVPREIFLPGRENSAYIDAPQTIGQGQTISAPHMVALMAQALDAQPGHRVLEVGAGSGYHAAVTAELVAPGGMVWSVERFPDLAAQARRNLEHAGCGPDRVEVVVGDGSLGWPDAAPYDAAYLTCATPQVPAPILRQVRVGGVVIAPVGELGLQELVLVEKLIAGVRVQKFGSCVFVPLVGEHGFPQEPRWN